MQQKKWVTPATCGCAYRWFAGRLEPGEMGNRVAAGASDCREWLGIDDDIKRRWGDGGL